MTPPPSPRANDFTIEVDSLRTAVDTIIKGQAVTNLALLQRIIFLEQEFTKMSHQHMSLALKVEQLTSRALQQQQQAPQTPAPPTASRHTTSRRQRRATPALAPQEDPQDPIEDPVEESPVHFPVPLRQETHLPPPYW